ncbi:MAG: TIGR03086 family metal-binding protein [Acidimicrobiia bacterium]
MDTLAQLEATYGSTQRFVNEVGPAQLDAPTPCRDWSVGLVLGHVVAVTRHFGGAAAGDAPEIPDPAEIDLGDDPAATYRGAAGAARAAWRAPGVLDGKITVAAGEMPAVMAAGISCLDTLVHGWDIARGTGQDATLDPALAKATLAFAQQIVTDEVRRFATFDSAVDIGADASATDRLVAFCGRRP